MIPPETEDVPVTLFTYNRAPTVARTLECLRREPPRILYVFSDGPRDRSDAELVNQVRVLIGAIDWCETRVVCREENMGVDASVLDGATRVFQRHHAGIFLEDDLVFVQGMYAYLRGALHAYRRDPRVISVTGWTHPMAIPRDVGTQPYFEGRSCSLAWGTWRDRWAGMTDTAETMAGTCLRRGIDCYRYGADVMRIVRASRNGHETWDARFGLLHLLRGGLCMRPPWSMVDHVGWGESATHAGHALELSNYPLRACPPIPEKWPDPREHPYSARLWRALRGGHPVRDVGSNVLYLANYVRRLAVRRRRARELRTMGGVAENGQANGTGTSA